MSQIGLFDVENKLAQLSAMGDPLEKLDKAVNWNLFKPVLNKAFCKERRSNAGRPPFDYVMMFKVLVLQTMYNLSDAQVQFQILDRHTFIRSIGQLRAASRIGMMKLVYNMNRYRYLESIA